MNSLPLIERPSPNNDARSPGRVVDMLVLHYTGMEDAQSALDRLCDPEAAVSAHYLIDEEGGIHRLVPEARRAWHAGAAAWLNETEINDLSVGVELVNPGHAFGYRPFTEHQMIALEELARDILDRHDIPPRRVLGHSDVAPSRKRDPGELLDWRRLARAGIGLWPEVSEPPGRGASMRSGDDGVMVAAAQAAFAAFGYGLQPNGVYDRDTIDVVTAFQRHFRPRKIDGRLDVETAAILKALLEMAD